MANALHPQSQNFQMCAQEVRGEVIAQQQEHKLLLHSCIIDGKPSVVYPRNLSQSAPQTFLQLQQFAAQHHLNLVEERRHYNQEVANNKRRPWLPILLLSISANVACADPNPEPAWEKSLNLTGDQQKHELTIPVKSRLEALSELQPELRNTGEHLRTILHEHFQPQVKDPHNIRDEIAQIATYYARFPEVVQLFLQIENLNWNLKFKKRTFRTDVTGNALTIQDTTVYFDPHVGARLRFQSSCKDKVPYCVASPADALLHELLHVKSILLNTREYIANGGMGGLLYPFKHEHETISQENVLYRAMTSMDGKPRPIRNEHTGRYILVACSTCIQ